MKVAVVCPYDMGRPGGVQSLTSELVGRLAAAGHQAWLVAPGGHGDVRSVGRSITVRANASGVPVALSPLVFGRVRREVAGADVVHVHEPLVPIVGWAGVSTDIPTVATFHADPPRWARRVYRVAARVPARRMRRLEITAVSRAASSAVPPSWGRPTIVPNAIDVASFASEGGERRGVVFLGRDDPRKGLDVFLRAWETVRARHPGLEAVVAGATREGDHPGVRFLGRVDEVAKRRALTAARILVAPNLGGESFGIVLAEGMAAGCVVVASDLPAFRPVLDDAGVLVPPGDAEALAEAIVGLVSNEPRMDSLASAAVARVGRFDWSVVLEHYLAAYHRAIESG